jgi:hypothetical protein
MLDRYIPDNHTGRKILDCAYLAISIVAIVVTIALASLFY